MSLPPYDREPVTTTDGTQVVGWSWPPAPVLDPTETIPARLDERYDPSPEPIDRKTR